MPAVETVNSILEKMVADKIPANVNQIDNHWEFSRMLAGRLTNIEKAFLDYRLESAKAECDKTFKELEKAKAALEKEMNKPINKFLSLFKRDK